MIFVTVGSSLPFDRLITAVDQLIESMPLNDVFAQIGESSYRPKNMRWASAMEKIDFDRRLAEATFIISHAGMGTISSALAIGKPIIVMPRQRSFGEAVNDHQVSTAERFAAAGHVLAARDARELTSRISEIDRFTPKPRSAQPEAVAGRIVAFLDKLI